jgi:hypothetical protein
MIIGVGALLPWNAILTALDWFGTRFSGYNASFIFTIMNFVPYTFMQPLTIWKGNNYPYNKRIGFPFIASAGGLALSPFIAILLPGLPGFILTCILVFLIGVVIAVA